MFRNKKRLTKYLLNGKLKLSSFFIFENKRAKIEKIFNLLKDHVSVMSTPMDMIWIAKVTSKNA